MHEAARVAGAASGNEILAGAAVLADADARFQVGERRHLELKGLRGPLEVATVAWR